MQGTQDAGRDVALRFRSIIQPYFGKHATIDLDAKLVGDLRITGSDYLDLVTDLEKEFETDLSEFLIGPEPKYISTGLIGWLIGQPKKSVFRDVLLRDLQTFLQGG
jgi:acyl carrier protein